MWLPFYERLVEPVDLIAPEHPGFGETAFPDWLDGFDDLVMHYAICSSCFGLDQAHLVGFSLGGWIAAELAIFHPERLKCADARSARRPASAGRAEAEPLRDDARGDLRDALQRQPRTRTSMLPNPHSLDDVVHAYGELGDVREAHLERRSTTRARAAAAARPAARRWSSAPRTTGSCRTRHADRFAELLPTPRLERIPGRATA